MEGAYGAWVNTDGFTIGEQKELYAGMRIFELAKAAKTVKHYVWSSLDYGFKVVSIFRLIAAMTYLENSTFQKGDYKSIYRCEHYDGKGRVADWMKAQPSIVNDADMSWSIVTSGPYMEMLRMVSAFAFFLRSLI